MSSFLPVINSSKSRTTLNTNKYHHYKIKGLHLDEICCMAAETVNDYAVRGAK